MANRKTAGVIGVGSDAGHGIAFGFGELAYSTHATCIHSQLIERKPFWEKELDASPIPGVSQHSAYVESRQAEYIMVSPDSPSAKCTAAVY